VLNSIRHTLQQAGDTRPYPRETFGRAMELLQGAPILQEGLGPEYKLTRDEVDAWMNSQKHKFYLLPGQVAVARADKLDRCLSSWQCSQRQYGRFMGMLKMIYGGKKNLQQFLENEKFSHRILPPVKQWTEIKPLEKRYGNKRSLKAKAHNKANYYRHLARDLMDPANAPKRATRRFGHLLEAMDQAKKGLRFFYPYPEGTTKASLQGGPEGKGTDAQGKGKGKSAWQHIHYNLLSAGLQVPNARPPRPPSLRPQLQGSGSSSSGLLAWRDSWSWGGPAGAGRGGGSGGSLGGSGGPGGGSGGGGGGHGHAPPTQSWAPWSDSSRGRGISWRAHPYRR